MYTRGNILLISLRTADVRSRIEPEIKERATEVLASNGLSLSDAIRLFLRQVVAQGGLPFEVKVPNAKTRAAMQEARAMRKQSSGLYNDLETNKAKTRKAAAK